MIRRDYVLRMIEEFRQVLAVLVLGKAEGRWTEVTGKLDEEFAKWLGVSAQEAAELSDTEISARLLRSEPGGGLREKRAIVVRLLYEAGTAARALRCEEKSRAFFLRGLSLLIASLAEGESPCEFDLVPALEAFMQSLDRGVLPAEVMAALMHVYEQNGAFAKAEDALFELLDAVDQSPAVLAWGERFYERLLAKNDAVLRAGDLPREEVLAGQADLRLRRGGMRGGNTAQSGA